MSWKPFYHKGDWKAICDVCGREYKASDLQKRWDGVMVCSQDWEPRHPQDFVRGVADIQAVPWSRPEGTDVFILACSTRSSLPTIAIAGCAVTANNIDPGSVPAGTF